MGWNTTVVVMNDALDAIAHDPEFGKKLARACTQAVHGRPVDVSASMHINAATVVETHHADGTTLVAVGGNYGRSLGEFYAYGDEDEDIRLLKALADKLGYRVSRKPQKK